ncbi:MAG: hypothetical protein SFU98_13915, partial [Leptospiraceae bacterium]|nr:hypothetical protein [Leptospiraceae bacterium]
NLNSGNNLETLVLYMASQGLISFDTSDVIRYSIYSSVLGNTLTPTELLAFSAISKTTINHEKNATPVFRLYTEFPFSSNLIFRIAYGGPIYSVNNYQYSLMSLDFSFIALVGW